MINKQGLWFITLFSLIVILSIYYFTLPNETLSVFDNVNDISDTIEITQSDVIVAMKVEEEEKIMSQISNAQETLLNVSSSTEEKNEAFNLLQKLNLQKGNNTDNVKPNKIEKDVWENAQNENTSFSLESVYTSTSLEGSEKLATGVVKTLPGAKLRDRKSKTFESKNENNRKHTNKNRNRNHKNLAWGNMQKKMWCPCSKIDNK